MLTPFKKLVFLKVFPRSQNLLQIFDIIKINHSNNIHESIKCRMISLCLKDKIIIVR